MLNIYTNTDTAIQRKEGNIEVFDFGTVQKGFDTSVEVFIEGNNINISDISSSCGCTVAEPKKINNNLYSLNITYKNSHIQKPFGKTVTVQLTENGAKTTKTLKIKGIIT